MKEETPVFKWNTKTKEFYVLGHKFEGVNSIEDFVKFLTDLQQENSELKKKLSSVEEYIIKNWDGSSYTDNTLKNKIAEINITELLEILRGNNNE